ncbi:hypothetical protein PVAP13_8KG331001 [Panicum virgatum]|uniref:Uncharacterized protein n=1 Tax=Panicum virgatum TaxID=38727 RepID=A0A8T0PJ49_PANVG|nr:hypothetical protein PVAP13_8KG331001 [Panicum virgatum]
MYPAARGRDSSAVLLSLTCGPHSQSNRQHFSSSSQARLPRVVSFLRPRPPPAIRRRRPPANQPRAPASRRSPVAAPAPASVAVAFAAEPGRGSLRRRARARPPLAIRRRPRPRFAADLARDSPPTAARETAPRACESPFSRSSPGPCLRRGSLRCRAWPWQPPPPNPAAAASIDLRVTPFSRPAALASSCRPAPSPAFASVAGQKMVFTSLLLHSQIRGIWELLLKIEDVDRNLLLLS